MVPLTETLRKAFDLHQTGRFDEADALYGRILALDPARPEALDRRGLLLAQLGRLEEAECLLRRALAVDTLSADRHANRGKILRALGQPDEAARAFARAMALRPDLPEAQDGFGHARRELGDFNQAAAAFGRAAACGGGASSLRHQATILIEADRLEEAVPALERAVALDPGDGSAAGPAALQLGALLWKLGAPERAGRWYRRAVALRPSHGESLRQLVALAQDGRDEETAARGLDRIRILLPDRTITPTA